MLGLITMAIFLIQRTSHGETIRRDMDKCHSDGVDKKIILFAHVATLTEIGFRILVRSEGDISARSPFFPALI